MCVCMRVRVCVCLCMCVCVRACMYVCVRACVRMCRCVHACMRACTCARERVSVHTLKGTKWKEITHPSPPPTSPPTHPHPCPSAIYFPPGRGGHGVEIRANQAVHGVHQRGVHAACALQHRAEPQVLVRRAGPPLQRVLPQGGAAAAGPPGKDQGHRDVPF